MKPPPAEGLAAGPIRTGRLTLVPLRADHATEMAAVLADPALYAFTGGSPPSPQQLRSRYERQVAGPGRAGESWCNWVIQLHDRGCLAGTVQATITAGGALVAEIAWVVGVPWQGQGIATEAARALVGWLGRHGVATVIAHINPRHQASASVAAAAGMSATGTWHDGEVRWQLTIRR